MSQAILTRRVPANLVFTEIGSDELVVIVHKSNPVASLNKTQLKGIATGKIVNWNEVGGPDLPIKVVVTGPSLAPGQFFKKAIMECNAHPGCVVTPFDYRARPNTSAVWSSMWFPPPSFFAITPNRAYHSA